MLCAELDFSSLSIQGNLNRWVSGGQLDMKRDRMKRKEHFCRQSDMTSMVGKYSDRDTGRTICSRTWVRLTWLSVFHHLDHLSSGLCLIPISPGRIGQTVELPKPNSTQPRLASGTPKTQLYPTHVSEQMVDPVKSQRMGEKERGGEKARQTDR